MKTQDNDTFNNIIKIYTSTSIYYKIQKNNLLTNQISVLISSITIIYILLKNAELFQLDTIFEIIAIILFVIVLISSAIYGCILETKKSKSFINEDLKFFDKIDLIYQSLIIRLQSNNNFNKNSININWSSLLKSIFVFFLGFYFSSTFEKQPLTGDNVIVLSTFTFFVLLFTALLFDIIKLFFNNTSLKYKCLFEEIEEYKLTSRPPKKKNFFKQIINFLFSY